MFTGFKGTITALITPFNNGKIDLEAFEKIVKFQVENEIDGILINGTTGESPNITLDEIKQMFEIANKIRNEKNQHLTIIIGCGSNATATVCKNIEELSNLNPDAFLVVTPYYNKPTQAGLIEHYKLVANSAKKIPIILYNVPGRTGCNILPDTVVELSKIDNIVSIKEASGNLIQISEIYVKACLNSFKNFTLLSGDDALTLPILSVGGMGVISVTSNIVPKLVKQCVNSYLNGDIVNALETHCKLLELHEILFIESNPIPVKTALSLMGLCKEEFRLPLVPMLPKNKEKLIEILKKYKLI